MSFKRKIKVVTGSWGGHVMPAAWEQVSSAYEIEFLVLESTEDRRIDTSLPVVVFPVIPEMNGFYRNLESFLAGADLVVTYETARLHSFQALRISRGMGLPCVVVAHEFTPYVYEKFSNIRAIQYDLNQNADRFIVTSSRAARAVQSEGVSIDRIVRMPAVMDGRKQKFSPVKAAKFRDYVGVRPEELLVVVRTSFEQTEGASTILHGLRMMLQRVSEHTRARVKVLVIGQGGHVERLKYEAVDHGLGSRTIFLAQDPTPFWHDVVSAAQVILWDRWRDVVHAEPYPFAMLEGLAAGAVTLVPSASVFDEVSAGCPVVRMDDLSPMDVAESLASIFLNVGTLESEREQRASQALQNCAMERIEPLLTSVFESLLANRSKDNARDRVISFVHEYPAMPTFALAKDVLLRAEELLLLANLDRDLHAELWRIKGDAQAVLSLGDGAVESYQKSLQTSEKCFRANRGLGYLAWQGHSHEDAVSFYKRALGAEPNDYHSLLGVGLVYRRLRMLDESVYWLNRAVEIGGPESSALNLLVQACVESAEAELSLATLERLRESHGDLPGILRGLSQVYLAHGRADEVSALLDQASAS